MKTPRESSAVGSAPHECALHPPPLTTLSASAPHLCSAHFSLSPGLPPSLAHVRELSLFCAHPVLYDDTLFFPRLVCGFCCCTVIHAHPGGSLPSSFIRINEEGRRRWFAKTLSSSCVRERGCRVYPFPARGKWEKFESMTGK